MHGWCVFVSADNKWYLAYILKAAIALLILVHSFLKLQLNTFQIENRTTYNEFRNYNTNQCVPTVYK